MPRRVAWWSADDGVPPIPVYVDEIPTLETDALLFGNVYVKANADGIHERIAPSRIGVVTPDDEGGI
jgi:hypothetical protein